MNLRVSRKFHGWIEQLFEIAMEYNIRVACVCHKIYRPFLYRAS